MLPAARVKSRFVRWQHERERREKKGSSAFACAIFRTFHQRCLATRPVCYILLPRHEWRFHVSLEPDNSQRLFRKTSKISAVFRNVTKEQACEERNLINILFALIHTASSECGPMHFISRRTLRVYLAKKFYVNCDKFCCDNRFRDRYTTPAIKIHTIRCKKDSSVRDCKMCNKKINCQRTGLFSHDFWDDSLVLILFPLIYNRLIVTIWWAPIH